MSLTESEELELLALLEEDAHYRSGRKIDQYFPDEGSLRRELYAKHMELFAAGRTHQMRLMLAANRIGKTEGFGCEFVYHLTGEYPGWWEGRRFDGPIVAWCAGDTNPKTQEILQAKLFGTDDCRQTERMGTGLIPRDSIKGITVRPGVAGAVLSARVAHKMGGESTVTLKSFEQGVESFQGNEVHAVWADELMPAAVLSECVVRITPTPWFEGGMIAWTVTPIEGLTDGIMEFLPDGQVPTEEQLPPKYVVNATWDDVPHLSEAAKATLSAGIPPYQLEARSRGIPMLGAGVIYPVPESDYLIDPFELPPHWRRAYALDVGWNRTAAIWGAYDPETDTWYLYNEHYRGQAEPSIHASAIRGRGDWIRGVIDPAARGRSQRDGRRLFSDYCDLGLSLSLANNAVEAGIYQVWERLSTGRLKVFSTLQNWLKEVRLYRRDEKGRIIKVNDHLMDGTRYLILSGGEVAEPVPVKKDERLERLPVRALGRHASQAWMG
ncbi:MAG: terminase large subunit domain-containing protein [Gammaproteobacteria bacterium]